MTTTHIEWTDEVWNPVTGCDKVSAGCKNCYAERMFNRLSHNPKTPEYNGRTFGDVMCHADRLEDPLKWKRPRRVFVNSMSDLFHESVPDAFIIKVFGTMLKCSPICSDTPNHTFQILTKRPERMVDVVTTIFESLLDHGLEMAIDLDRSLQDRVRLLGDEPARRKLLEAMSHIWLGVSVENQEQADKRIPLLLQCPAAVRWLSCEPLLGAIDLERWIGHKGKFYDIHSRIDWVVVGGESGPKARPMHPDWARSLRDQCQAAGVPFFFKQWGEWISVEHEEFCRLPSGKIMHIDRSGGILDPAPQDEDADCTTMKHVSKHRAGRMLLGREWNEMPVR